MGALFPYGLFIALRAAIVGCKYATVITQGNHHEDVYSAAFDRFGGFQKEYDNRERYSFGWGSAKPFFINRTKTIFSHTPWKDGTKDWSEVLFSLTEENHEL